jgi:hypothetical protein
MDKTMNEKITPEESLLLITKTIEETKQRFKENGHIIILWGTIDVYSIFKPVCSCIFGIIQDI